VTCLVGTSGWQYRDWRGLFYPERLAQRLWLAHYAARFATVELNNSFYRLPPTETFQAWRDNTPADFVVAVKASRYLTHVKRLKDPAEPVGRLMEHAAGLGNHLGPVLVQLPPNMVAAPEALDATLACFGRSVRVAVEVRHPSWFAPDAEAPVRRVLEAHNAAWVMADGGPVDLPHWVTADWSYVRFHRGRSHPPFCYTRHALDVWAGRLADLLGADTDVYCYFNNDPNGCAVRDARVFAGLAARHGLEPTRVPGPRETPVAG
jgi:uncharacterized protein YecE (DUF72 family)